MMKNNCLIIFTLFLFAFSLQTVGQTTGNSTTVENKYEVVKLTQAEFEKMIYNPLKDGDSAVYKGRKPCIVDFYADWCRPCKMLSPILEELYRDYKGKIIVYKVNVDEQKALASQYGISSIPTLLLFAVNKKPASIKGYVGKEELKKYIEQYLKP
jgi:thioredoxin 1